MSAADFQLSLKLVLLDEGGFDDDPHDHGGRTAHGIIQREYDAYRVRKGEPKQDVWKINSQEYAEIYHESYWLPWCDKLPKGFDYEFFDTCVNAGPVQATRTLQQVLKLRVDGHMGPVTLAAVDGRPDTQLIQDYSNARVAFYKHLRQFPRYGRGWLARVERVQKSALALASDVPWHHSQLSPELKAQATARANSDDVKPWWMRWLPHGVTLGAHA